MSKRTKLPKLTDEVIKTTIEAALLLLPDGTERRAALSWVSNATVETINQKQLFLIIGRASRDAGVRVNCAGKAFETALEACQGLSPQSIETALKEGFRRCPNKDFVNPFEVIGIIDEAQAKQTERLANQPKQRYIISYEKLDDGSRVPVYNT